MENLERLLSAHARNLPKAPPPPLTMKTARFFDTAGRPMIWPPPPVVPVRPLPPAYLEFTCDPLHAPRVPLVYFIDGSDGGPIKIGHVRAALHLRLKTHQCGCPYPIRVLALATGGQSLEGILHARFAGDRLHGEWFRPSLELMTYIGSLQVAWMRAAWNRAVVASTFGPTSVATGWRDAES